ncbi:MAG: DUF6364 family protein [bacterium]
MGKTHINISLDKDLAEFAKEFAAENRITVADMITQYLLALKRREEGKRIEQVLADPSFEQAMEEVRDKLRQGRDVWYSYHEVFED